MVRRDQVLHPSDDWPDRSEFPYRALTPSSERWPRDAESAAAALAVPRALQPSLAG